VIEASDVLTMIVNRLLNIKGSEFTIKITENVFSITQTSR